MAARVATGAEPVFPPLDPQQLTWLGDQVFRNECNSQPACLTAWNDGEEFPSLGIGHFIWLQRGQQVPYVETFPALLDFLQLHGTPLPAWLSPGLGQPWPSRERFLAERDGPRLTELRELLARTRDLQTAFIVQRFDALATDTTGPFATDTLLRRKLLQVAHAQIPYGPYALIDYVHFKGDGTKAGERYQGKGWGLVQVLERMPDTAPDPLQAFVASATGVLQERVANAPPQRKENRWLAGWLKRLQSYLPPAR